MCHPTGPERSAGRAERVDTPAVPQLPHPRRSMAPSIDPGTGGPRRCRSHPKMVGMRFQVVARAAGVEHVTAHSGRVGLALELTSRGASEPGCVDHRPDARRELEDEPGARGSIFATPGVRATPSPAAEIVVNRCASRGGPNPCRRILAGAARSTSPSIWPAPRSRASSCRCTRRPSTCARGQSGSLR